MKHKVESGDSKIILILYSISFLIAVACFSFLIAFLLLKILGSDNFLFLLFSRLFGLTIFLSPFIILFTIIGITNLTSPYIQSICSAYTWSIKEALKTEYPHGVIYILENILKELDKFGLDLNPDSKYHDGKKYGFPNKTNLKETIKMARELSKDWEQLDALEPAKASQYMAAIRARIQQEDMYLWTNIKPKGDQDIYYFSYGEEDYQAEMQLENSSYQSSRVSNKHPEQDYHLENTSNNTHNSNILDFQDWLAQNSALQYVSELEQEKAYARYTQSFEVDEEKPYYS